MWGPFFKGLGGLVRGKLHKSLLLLALGFIVGVGVLQVGAMAKFGVEPVKTQNWNRWSCVIRVFLVSRSTGGLGFETSY